MNDHRPPAGGEGSAPPPRERPRPCLRRLTALALLLAGLGAGPGSVHLAAAPATVAVSVEYEDKDLAASGFTGSVTRRPGRGLSVAAWSADGAQLLAGGTTDAAGTVTLTVEAGVSPAVSVKVVVSAEVVFAEGDRVRVYDHPQTRNLYAAESAPFEATAGATTPVALLVPADQPGDFHPGGAFHVLDWAVTVRARLRTAEGGAPPVKDLDVFTQPGLAATYYVNLDPGQILLYGGDAAGRGDTDFYDDTVLVHEMGHHNGSVLGVDSAYGGPHSLTARIDPRLAFSEGWGTFFAGWVLGSSRYTDTSDTLPGAAFSFEFETPDFADQLTRANNEGAVLAALWDVLDGAAGGGPADADGDPAALAAAVAHLLREGIDQAGSTRTFEPIVTGLAAADGGAPATLAALAEVLRGRTIEFAPLEGVSVVAHPGVPFVFPESEGPFDFPLEVASALSRRITTVAVNVEMSNPPPLLLRNEFRLELLAPDGATYLLRDFVADDRSGIMQYFGEPTWAAPATSFAPLVASRLEGTWTLRVTRRRTQGALNPLRLHHFRLFVRAEVVGAADGMIAR